MILTFTANTHLQLVEDLLFIANSQLQVEEYDFTFTAITQLQLEKQHSMYTTQGCQSSAKQRKSFFCTKILTPEIRLNLRR